MNPLSRLDPKRRRELLIGAGVLGALVALVVLQRRAKSTPASSSGTVGALFDPSSYASGFDSGGGLATGTDSTSSSDYTQALADAQAAQADADAQRVADAQAAAAASQAVADADRAAFSAQVESLRSALAIRTESSDAAGSVAVVTPALAETVITAPAGSDVQPVPEPLPPPPPDPVPVPEPVPSTWTPTETFAPIVTAEETITPGPIVGGELGLGDIPKPPTVQATQGSAAAESGGAARAQPTSSVAKPTPVAGSAAWAVAAGKKQLRGG